MSEYILRLYYDGNEEVEEIHEEISRRIIKQIEEITDLIGKERSEKIANLLRTDIEQDYKHDIISGPIDADKMDYLLRDSYYSGVKYGVFDIERLLNVMTAIRIDNELRLGVKCEGVETVEQYVLAKYFITRQVYQHKTRRITDLMITEGIKSSIESGNETLKKLYTYDDQGDYLKYYLEHDDNKVIDSVLKDGGENNLGYKLFKMLKERSLLKELYSERIADLRVPPINTNKLNELEKGKAYELKASISKEADLDNNFTYILFDSIKAPYIIKSDNIFNDKSILIELQNETPEILEKKSFLFNHIKNSAGERRISVYGLPKDSLDKKQKDDVREKIENEIIKYFGGV